MRDPSTFQLVLAASQFVPGLLWAVMSRGHWQVLRTRRPRSTPFRLLLAVTALGATHYLLFALLALVPGHVRGPGSVADNGPGVSAEALPQLFEPFYTQKAHGTGLGLAIARRTLEAHGGHITAAPAGTTGLVMALPLARGSER